MIRLDATDRLQKANEPQIHGSDSIRPRCVTEKHIAQQTQTFHVGKVW